MEIRAVMGLSSDDGTSQTLLVDVNGSLISHLFSERFLEFKLQRPSTVLDQSGHSIRNKFNLERARDRLL